MRLIDGDALAEIFSDRMEKIAERYGVYSSESGILSGAYTLLQSQPTIEPQPEIIRCKDCKHRPTSTEADGYINGFSLEFPDNVCPCQCEDGWYNWYPSDDFYCGVAERGTG